MSKSLQNKMCDKTLFFARLKLRFAHVKMRKIKANEKG